MNIPGVKNGSRGSRVHSQAMTRRTAFLLGVASAAGVTQSSSAFAASGLSDEDGTMRTGEPGDANGWRSSKTAAVALQLQDLKAVGPQRPSEGNPSPRRHFRDNNGRRTK
jgi:hypothetical protein